MAAAMTQQFLHERRYRLIFGSQLNLLKRLHEGLLSTTSEAAALYEIAKSMAREVYNRFDITFDRWLSFLTSENLVGALPEAKARQPQKKGLASLLVGQQN